MSLQNDELAFTARNPPSAASSSLIVLTCASGKQCSHLIPHLYNNPAYRLRLVVNSQSSHSRLSDQYPSAEVVRAELTQSNDCARILSGASAIYHVGPSFHPHEKEIGYNVIDAAVAESQSGQNSKFSHFIYSSVLHTQIRKMINHDLKRYVEEYLLESGLNYTILQPSNFMDAFPVAMLMQQENPVYHARFDPEIQFSQTALRDLAEASATVVAERERHFGAEYPVVSTRPTPYRAVVEEIGRQIGRKVKIEVLGYDQAVKGLLAMLYGPDKEVPRGTRDMAQRMLLYYDHYGLKGNPNVLEWLLGRKPTSHEEWVKGEVEKARAKEKAA